MAINNSSSTANSLILDCTKDRPVVFVNYGLPETIFWVAVGLATIMGNAAGIRKLLKSRLTASHHIYMFCLLSSDLAISVVIHPALAYGAYTAIVPCKMLDILRPFGMSYTSMSLLLSLAIAVGRFRALSAANSRVVNSMQSHHRAMRRKTSLLAVAFISLTSILVGLLFAFSSTGAKVIQLIYPLAFICVVVLYTIISVKLRNIFKTTTALTRRNFRNTQHSRCARLMSCLLCNTIITWLPICILRILQNRVGILVDPQAMTICTKLVFLGPTFDPLCYALARDRSRR